MPDDYEGKVIATLLRADSTAPSDRAVLYLHGYIDYFFQTHMAERFAGEEWNFYALDLRKYGRSLLPHQHAYYCRDLHEYFPEIDAALERIASDGNTDITLLGHSTGGLIAALYAAQGRERMKVNRLVLNSPFFAFNVGWFKRAVAVPAAAWLSRLMPYAAKRNELSPLYYVSVHRSMKGEWDFDPRLKPRREFRSILHGSAQSAAGSISCAGDCTWRYRCWSCILLVRRGPASGMTVACVPI